MRKDGWIILFVPLIITSFLLVLLAIWEQNMWSDYSFLACLVLIPFALFILMCICIKYFSEPEEQGKDNETRFARRSLKKHFKKFLLFWESNAKSFSQVDKNISRERWIEIEAIAKKLKDIVESNEISLDDEIENEANERVDDVLFLSQRIRASANTIVNTDVERERRISLINSGEDCVNKIKKFINKI